MRFYLSSHMKHKIAVQLLIACVLCFFAWSIYTVSQYALSTVSSTTSSPIELHFLALIQNLQPVVLMTIVVLTIVFNIKTLVVIKIALFSLLWSYFPRHIHSEEAIQAYQSVQYPYITDHIMSHDEILVDLQHLRTLEKQLGVQETRALLEQLQSTATGYMSANTNIQETDIHW